MCNVSLMIEPGKFRNIAITGEETVNDILEFFHINPQTKIVYKNGKILSRDMMNEPLPKNGTVHLTVKNKTIYRD